MIRKGPKESEFQCPNCGYIEIIREGINRVRCGWCKTQWAVKFDDGMEVKLMGEKTTKEMEQCPNSECGRPWECWLTPNRALAAIHGAQRISLHTVICDSCGTKAKVTFGK